MRGGRTEPGISVRVSAERKRQPARKPASCLGAAILPGQSITNDLLERCGLFPAVASGYVLARTPDTITLAQIISAVDGPIVAGEFGEPHADGACNHEGQCVLLAFWAEVGERMREHLASFTLADMVSKVQVGGAVLSVEPEDSGVVSRAMARSSAR